MKNMYLSTHRSGGVYPWRASTEREKWVGDEKDINHENRVILHVSVDLIFLTLQYVRLQSHVFSHQLKFSYFHSTACFFLWSSNISRA